MTNRKARSRKVNSKNGSFQPDVPATEDAFGRRAFASALARSLALPAGAPGLVVGIEGQWGTGTGTVINFVTAALVKNQTIVVTFNPWMISGSHMLVETMLTQIASAIGQSTKADQAQKGIKVSQNILKYVRLFKYLKYVPGASWAGNLAEDATDTIADVAKKGAKVGSEALEDIKSLTSKLDIHRRRQDIVDALSELDESIVVVIDDLDRLEPTEIPTLFQAIKAVADFPRVCYLLAYDPAVVGQALGKNQGPDRGRAYLEKLVQVAYPLPHIFPWQFRKYVESSLRLLIGNLKLKLKNFEKKRLESAVSMAAKICRHPRDVLRLLNRLTLSLPATYGEVNCCDVIVFEAVCQIFPSIRDAIRHNPEDFTGRYFVGDNDSTTYDWEQWFNRAAETKEGRWKNHLPDDPGLRKLIEQSCLFLFPRLGADKQDGNATDELRIEAIDRLMRLFALSTVENVAEAKDIHALLLDEEQLANALDVDDHELEGILASILEYVGSCETGSWVKVVEEFSRRSELLGAQGLLSHDVSTKFGRIFIRILEKSGTERQAIFYTAIDNVPLSISHDVILRAAGDVGKWPLRPQPSRVEKQLIPDVKLVESTILRWCGKVSEAAKSGRLKQEPRLHAILFRWWQLGRDIKPVLNAVRDMCKTKDGLQAFVYPYGGDISMKAIEEFELVWDPKELLKLLKAQPELEKDRTEFINLLKSEQLKEHLRGKRIRQ